MLRELSEGPNRSSHELAPAVRTTPGKHTLCTVPAEGAFEGTDKGVGGFRWQVCVATLAVRTKLEHFLSRHLPGKVQEEISSCAVSPGREGKGLGLLRASHQIWRARRDFNPRPSAPEADARCQSPRQMGPPENRATGSLPAWKDPASDARRDGDR